MKMTSLLEPRVTGSSHTTTVPSVLAAKRRCASGVKVRLQQTYASSSVGHYRVFYLNCVCTNLNTDKHVFSVAVPTIWNQLPITIKY